MMFRPLTERVQQQAERAREKVALVQGTRQVTYGELWASIARLSGSLRGRGFLPGQRGVVLLDNSPEYVAAYYAIWAAGGVAVGLNTATKARELATLLAHCDASLLFVQAGRADLKELLGLIGPRVQAIACGGSPAPEGTTSLDDLLAESTSNGSAVSVEPDDKAVLIYTSGTTGRPKGVTLTHKNLAANTDSIVEYLAITADDRCLNVLPFYYSYGSSVLHTHLCAGATLILDAGMVYPHRIVERMQNEKVTAFPGVPATYSLLLKRVDLSQYDLSSLRYMTQAGAAMPPAMIEQVRKQLPHVRFFVMYGQTEATARLTYLPPERLEDKLGSVGIGIPGVTIEIQDERGQPVPVGQIGEVCARGDNIMAGYWNDPQATAEVVRDGWLRTGDLGRKDGDGFTFLEGRQSDMIKSGAHRISPLDVEEVIAGLEGVAQVAVVGVPDEVLGQAIKAVIVPAPGASLNPRVVQRYCHDHLSPIKVPRVVEFAAELPMTASGKIKRHLLAQ